MGKNIKEKVYEALCCVSGRSALLYELNPWKQWTASEWVPAINALVTDGIVDKQYMEILDGSYKFKVLTPVEIALRRKGKAHE